MPRKRAAAALLLLAFQQPQRAGDPRATTRAALAAVEGDSAPALEARYTRLLRRDPADRAALLGLGALARLTYDYGRSDSLLPRVTTLRDDDALADYARLELGATLAARGRFRPADSAYSAALAGAERRGDSTAVGDALLGLAVPRSRLAAPASVLSLLDRAERLARGDPRGVANARCQRAALLSRTGGAGAGELAESGAALARGAGDLRQEARCIQVIAQDLALRGDMDGAGLAFIRAAPLYERGRDHASLASLRQWRGYLHVSLGNYGPARLELAAAVAEGERAQAMSPVGWALISLGMISLGTGDRLSASQQLSRAVQLLEAQGDQWGVATARGMLGGVARSIGDSVAAREAYTRVLAWADRSGQKLTQLNMHTALASLAETAGDWPLAARELEAARAIAVAGQMPARVNGLRYNVGRLALRRGDLVTAERELVALLATTDTSQGRWRYRMRTHLAHVYIRLGAVDRAEAELVAASQELDRWRASLSEHDLRVRAMEFDQGWEPEIGEVTVIAALASAGRLAPAFELAERRRARELVDGIQRAGAASGEDARDTSPARPDAVVPDDYLTDDSTALLEYVADRSGEPTTLFIVTRGGTRARQLTTADSLADPIRRFLAVLEAGGDIKVLGRRLGDALLAPALDSLPAAVHRLIIVPDDILARVPFDALVLGDGRFALERFGISVAPSAATVAALRSRRSSTAPVRILALGDPAFAPGRAGETGRDPSTIIYRDAFDSTGGLARLAGSAREAREVARFAPGAVLRLRGAASEAWLRGAALDSFRVVHFATHALVDDETVSRTALALAPGGGHDGFLGPGDLATLRFDADLVVLSACRTAGGLAVRGEGVQGLTAPLLQAGARSIVATSWRIADESAERIVGEFYRGLASGNTVSDALRAAKLAALRAGAQPSEWAAFVALGDPMTRIPLVMPVGTGMPSGGSLALLAAILLLLVGYGVMRKRRGAAAA